MRVSTLIAATLAASATASEFYWKHDSEWVTDANWVGGAKPDANSFAAFGVFNAAGAEDACAQMDAVVNVQTSLQTGGLVMGKGVEIQLTKGSELEIGKTATDDVVQWRCKTETDIDYRCSANWKDGAGKDVAEIPCGDDDIFFEAASFNVNNAGVPLVNTVTIGATEYRRPQAIAAISSDFKGFSRSFVPFEDFPSDKATEAAAALECFDSCPELNTQATDSAKYQNEHQRLQKRQEFLSQARAQLDDDFEANIKNKITVSEQANVFGRATLYVFNPNGASDKADPTVSIAASKDDSFDFLGKVEAAVSDHFAPQQTLGGCLRPGGQAFTFTPANCVALAGFGGDKVNGCSDGVNQYDDECPAEKSLVCPDPTHINVATRFAVVYADFRSMTCGDFEHNTNWFSAGAAGIQDDVTTADLQFDMNVNLFGPSLIATTKHILHGANRGSRNSAPGVCSPSFIATDSGEQGLPINLNAATGEFLAVGEFEDLNPEIAVAAIATDDMAAALASYEVSEKEADFDEKFHVKKFRGQDPDGRRRRNFGDIKKAVQAKLQAELPFGERLTIDTVVDGKKEGAHDAQLIVKGFGLTWFEADSIATISRAQLEPYVANVLLAYGMEAQEYALKLEEYSWLTTSTTTKTTATTTITVTTVTAEASASGIPGYVTDKDGVVLCRSGSSPCPDDDKVKSLASMVDAAKEVFGIESEAAQKIIDDADYAIANLREDMATKSAIYKSMKAALNACDKQELDKIETISYPDECSDEKDAYNAAADDFVTFVAGNGPDFDNRVAAIYMKKGAAMSALAELQADYKKDLIAMINYDAAAHGTEDTASYKQPEEVKDLQTSFNLVVDELEVLMEAVEGTKKELAAASQGNFMAASNEMAALEAAESKAEAALKECTDTEESRLADVPSTALTPNSKIYKEEVELKESTIASTCRPYTAELEAIQKQMGNNVNKFNNLKSATDDAYLASSETIEELETFQNTERSTLQSAINARVDEDEAFPLLYIVIAGAGALVLILIVALVMTSGGGGGGGGQQWASGNGAGSSVAFENPVYDDEQIETGAGNFTANEGDDADDQGLYDEPEMFADGGGDNAGAGGGYLDVEPDEDGDDDDEEESEEEEEEEEDEDEEDDDDDEEEDDEEDEDDEDSDE